MATTTFVSIAEAAFIAEVPDRAMNRAVDEAILPSGLVDVRQGRRFARLGAAFAGFYFGTEDVFVADLRRRVVAELTERTLERRDSEALLGLSFKEWPEIDWSFTLPSVRVEPGAFIERAWRHVLQIESARRLVATEPQVLNGMPTFSGTRVAVDVVLSSLDQGISFERLRASYPFLTQAHLDAARTFTTVNPRRGRPPRLSELHPGLKVVSRKTVRRAS